MDLLVLLLFVVVVALIIHMLLAQAGSSPWVNVIRIICALILLLYVLSRIGIRLPNVLP